MSTAAVGKIDPEDASVVPPELTPIDDYFATVCTVPACGLAQ
jgi:hypothetical protein